MQAPLIIKNLCTPTIDSNCYMTCYNHNPFYKPISTQLINILLQTWPFTFQRSDSTEAVIDDTVVQESGLHNTQWGEPQSSVLHQPPVVRDRDISYFY